MICKKHIYSLINFKKNIKSLKSFLTNKPFRGTKRVYHIHLMKTGGTSINNSFLNLSDEKSTGLYSRLMLQSDLRLIHNDWVYAAFNQFLISFGIYHYAWSHRPFYKIYLPKNTFTITCIRHPYERIFSRYKHLIKNYGNGKNIKRSNDYEYSKLGNSFEEYLNNLSKHEICYQLHMFSKKLDVDEALDNLKKVDYILITNSLSSDLEELSNILGVNLKLFKSRKIGKSIDEEVKKKFKSVERLLELELKFFNNATKLKKQIKCQDK